MTEVLCRYFGLTFWHSVTDADTTTSYNKEPLTKSFLDVWIFACSLSFIRIPMISFFVWASLNFKFVSVVQYQWQCCPWYSNHFSWLEMTSVWRMLIILLRITIFSAIVKFFLGASPWVELKTSRNCKKNTVTVCKIMEWQNRRRLHCLWCGQLLHNKHGFVILGSTTLQWRFCYYTGVWLATVVTRLRERDLVHFLWLDFVLTILFN